MMNPGIPEVCWAPDMGRKGSFTCTNLTNILGYFRFDWHILFYSIGKVIICNHINFMKHYHIINQQDSLFICPLFDSREHRDVTIPKGGILTNECFRTRHGGEFLVQIKETQQMLSPGLPSLNSAWNYSKQNFDSPFIEKKPKERTYQPKKPQPRSHSRNLEP